jgi:hypothetical protein
MTVTVNNDNNILLKSEFKSSTQPPVGTFVLFEEISDSGIINFSACCVGEASVVFGASFIPRDIPTQPIDRGIIVSRIIQLVDPVTNQPTGGPIFEATVGQLVLTTIQITTRDYGNAIKIVDAFPGAFDPLDDSIYDTDNSPPVYYSWFYWYYWRAFTDKEFLKDKVVFTGQNLYPGTYTVKYYSLISTPGIFVLPPTQAYDVFQPELMGTSAGGSFITNSYVNSTIVDMGTCIPWTRRIIMSPNIEVMPYLTSNLPVGLGIGLSIGILLLIGLILGYLKFFHNPIVSEPTKHVESL